MMKMQHGKISIGMCVIAPGTAERDVTTYRCEGNAHIQNSIKYTLLTTMAITHGIDDTLPLPYSIENITDTCLYGQTSFTITLQMNEQKKNETR